MNRQLAAETMDLLTQLETLLRHASIQEQTAIENAAEIAYGPNQGDHYTRLTEHITSIRDRLYDQLDQPTS